MKRLLSIQEIQDMLLAVMKEFDVFCKKKNLTYYLIGGSLLGAVRHGGFIPWDDDMDVGMLREEYERFLLEASQFPKQYDVENYRTARNCDFVITRIYINNTQIDNPRVRNTKLDQRLYFDIFPLDYVPDEESEAWLHAKRIQKKKKLLARIDAKNNENGTFQMVIKKTFSLFLAPFRKHIILSLEREMTRYKEGTNHCCSLASQYSYQKQYFKKSVYGEPKEYSFGDCVFWGPEKSDEYLSQLYGNDYMEVPPLEKRRKGWNVYIWD